MFCIIFLYPVKVFSHNIIYCWPNAYSVSLLGLDTFHILFPQILRIWLVNWYQHPHFHGRAVSLMASGDAPKRTELVKGRAEVWTRWWGSHHWRAQALLTFIPMANMSRADFSIFAWGAGLGTGLVHPSSPLLRF